MKPKATSNLVAGLLAAAAVVFGAVAEAATQDTHRHEPGAAVHALKLNAGKKWATDEPLRQGMVRIREAVEPRLEAVHAGRLTAAQYDALGKEVEGQIAYMVQNCKLEPQADEVLHVILADMIEGADALQGRNKKVQRSAGAFKIVHGLENYGTYFDHPGWQAPKAGH